MYKIKNIKFIVLWILLLLNLANYKILSQSTSSLLLRNSSNNNYSSERSFSNDINMLGNNFTKVITSPLSWNENDLIMFGGFAILSGSSFLLDDEVRILFNGNQNKFNDNLAPIGYVYGSPLYTIPASLLTYVSGLASGNNWLRDTGLMLTETLLVIGIVQVPTRIIMGRARPYVGEGNDSFKFLKGVAQDRASFISGHAAIAFGISNILSHKINNPYATIGLFTLASLTPLSRLYDDKHWFSDVFIGTAMGIFISNSIINLHQEKSFNRISIIPTFNGIAFTYRLN